MNQQRERSEMTQHCNVRDFENIYFPVVIIILHLTAKQHDHNCATKARFTRIGNFRRLAYVIEYVEPALNRRADYAIRASSTTTTADF